MLVNCHVQSSAHILWCKVASVLSVSCLSNIGQENLGTLQQEAVLMERDTVRMQTARIWAPGTNRSFRQGRVIRLQGLLAEEVMNDEMSAGGDDALFC